MLVTDNEIDFFRSFETKFIPGQKKDEFPKAGDKVMILYSVFSKIVVGTSLMPTCVFYTTGTCRAMD